jgi:hypothetical protein
MKSRIASCQLVPLDELRGMALTGPVAIYLGRTLPRVAIQSDVAGATHSLD